MAKQFYVALGNKYVEFIGTLHWRLVDSPHDADLFSTEEDAVEAAEMFGLHKQQGFAVGEITDAD